MDAAGYDIAYATTKAVLSYASEACTAAAPGQRGIYWAIIGSGIAIVILGVVLRSTAGRAAAAAPAPVRKRRFGAGSPFFTRAAVEGLYISNKGFVLAAISPANDSSVAPRPVGELGCRFCFREPRSPVPVLKWVVLSVIEAMTVSGWRVIPAWNGVYRWLRTGWILGFGGKGNSKDEHPLLPNPSPFPKVTCVSFGVLSVVYFALRHSGFLRSTLF